jgi:hypothetical protein
MEKIDKNIPDIPDFNEQEIPRARISEEVLNERNVRRYTRKDGTFNKDFERSFDRNTNKLDSVGRIIYEQVMTKEEAQKYITELCEMTGRKVVIDSLSGRPRAVPGWNLEIRVPGMSQSEQKAATVPEGELRERINNQLILDQRNQIDELTIVVKNLLDKNAEVEDTTDPGDEKVESGKGKGKGKG